MAKLKDVVERARLDSTDLPAAPERLPSPDRDPRDEQIALLRAQLDELRLRQSAPVPLSTAVRPGRYRVTVEGAPVRVVDSEGRPGYQPHLDVEATSEGDAFAKWKLYQGAISTVAHTRTELLPADQLA